MIIKDAAKTLMFLSSFLVLMACEPPTPTLQPTPIPEYTFANDWSGWKLKVSSFNVWGLPAISKDKEARMPAIGRAVRSRNVDLALFQEAWLGGGRRDIHHNSGLPYRVEHTFSSAPLDSGVMFLSRTPFARNSFRPFQLFGPLYLPDAWAVKGIGMVSTEVRGLPLSIYSSHLMAGLSRGENSRSPFTPEWKAEIFELFAHIVEQTDSDAFLIGMDMNLTYKHEEYEFFKKLTGLEGTWLEENNSSVCTWCAENSYASGKNEQLDYVVVSPRLMIVEAKVDFKEKIRIDNRLRNLSDHYGLSVELEVVDTNTNNTARVQAVRTQTREAFADLREELDELLVVRLQEEAELQAKGIEDRVCHSCRVRTVLKMLDDYQAAIDLPYALLSEQQVAIAVRLNSYFNLFR